MREHRAALSTAPHLPRPPRLPGQLSNSLGVPRGPFWGGQERGVPPSLCVVPASCPLGRLCRRKTGRNTNSRPKNQEPCLFCASGQNSQQTIQNSFPPFFIYSINTDSFPSARWEKKKLGFGLKTNPVLSCAHFAVLGKLC